MQIVGLVTWLDLGRLGQDQKSTFSEYGHAAYQIKGNKTYSNMQYFVLPTNCLDTWGGVGLKLFFF